MKHRLRNAPPLSFLSAVLSKYVCPEPVLVKWWRFQYSKTAAARNFSCLAVDAKVIDVGACINSRVRSFLKKISPCVCCSCSRLGKVIVFKMSADKNDGRSIKTDRFLYRGSAAAAPRGPCLARPRPRAESVPSSKNRRCAFSNECFPCACPESVLGK